MLMSSYFLPIVRAIAIKPLPVLTAALLVWSMRNVPARSFSISEATVSRRMTPSELIAEGEKLVLRGEVKRAVAAYEEARSLNPMFEIGAGSWNRLCWYGSLWQEADAVLEACNRAVELSPEDPEIRDSRALARALTGDIDGAIADFQFFVDNTEDPERKFQRQQWIEALKDGENPFTSEVLRLLFVD
jgi:tetratricopeptide (TPR) repeat protein